MRRTTVPVARLFDVPDGHVRRGDEIHDPTNWVCCSNCGLDNPMSYENCFDCGKTLTDG